MTHSDLKFFNTLHRQPEIFKSLKDGQVGLYTCGPTVYNPVTLGNLRAYVFADTLRRTLEFFDYEVTHVMNITDVGHLVGDRDEGEDKIEQEAQKTGKTAQEIAREYEKLFFRDLGRLNIKTPTKTPRATDHIEEQITLIQQLEQRGLTYRTSDGIYFDTSKFPTYGKLSGQKLEDKEAGARVAVNPEKKQPSDFALWKFSPTDQKRHMEWESPWGKGFPGWHIECSAMSVKYLGQPFDIHTGGVDHISVHHENEIAQTEAATGKPLANYWLHNEFLLVDGRRMGKSEGNAYTLDDVIGKGFDPLAFRYYCLGTHYRSKMNFTWEGLEAAQHALQRLRTAVRELDRKEPSDDAVMTDFRQVLADDLNTPKALAVLWEMLAQEPDISTLKMMDQVLGLNLVTYVGKKINVPQDIQVLAEERQQARVSKDWKRADALRKKIETAGWRVEDKEEGYDLVPMDER